MDFLNFTMPCGDSCPFHLATPQKCSLNHDRTKLFMDFSAPIINENLTLVEADPFLMMLKKENETCSVRYTGPTNAIISTKTNESCVYGLNLNRQVTHDIILSPASGCKEYVSKKGTKYFSVAECSKTDHNDYADFVQVKPHHGLYYIYCPESTIAINDKKQHCPDHVFTLPINANFRINEIEFVGTHIDITHQQRNDPLFTLNTNWFLNPSVNWTSLIVKEPVIKPIVNELPPEIQQFHTTSWIMFSVIIFLLLIIFLVGFWRLWQHRKSVSVVAQPFELVELPNNNAAAAADVQ